MAGELLLALDQGTSSSRALVFDPEGRVLGLGQQEFTQHYPQPGWVEHDPVEIWTSTLAVARAALGAAGVGAEAIRAIGITNQRETTVLWERATGRPVHRAIVWQDRRTAAHCERLRAEGLEAELRSRTGLLLDPYFSATKLAWLLDQVPDGRARAGRGELAFGTIDSWLLWQLTEGRVHATDVTNASRTMLWDLREQCWSEALLTQFGIPAEVLPEVCDSSGVLAETAAVHFGVPIPIAGIAGDQQAALFGQACLSAGQSKSTYGTGCFAMTHTGAQPVWSDNRLLTTVASRIDGRMAYAVEGSIFVAGAAVKWLRDELRIITHATDTEACARRTGGDTGGVYLVPAFTGLGAPWWDPTARGLLCGMTLDTGVDEIVTAALQAVAFQTRDLVDAMAADGARPEVLRIDGGMVVNDWLCQCIADLVGVPVERPRVNEITALGAAFLAGLATGVYRDQDDLQARWELDRRFEPALASEHVERLLEGWRSAVERSRSRSP
ncbi:MAG: glycerol kinase GlpK [Pseudomonadales bacterium]|jgi:glycerol kinase|nr:glycerol kinase GlpK [Pseudomonadales bacterium]